MSPMTMCVADGGGGGSTVPTDGGKTLDVTGKWMFFSKEQKWQRVE